MEETKKGSPQKEINSSVANEKICDKSILETSMFPNTQIPDEAQVKVGPTRHNEEV
jgi:hypothetical protein